MESGIMALLTSIHQLSFRNKLVVFVYRDSVGSLGANNSRSRVRDVIMDTVTIVGTMNGVRIKTWQVNINSIYVVEAIDSISKNLRVADMPIYIY